MRFRSALPLPLLLAAISCGYIGPVLPPSAGIPSAVSDLTVAERGDQLVCDFTTPPRTTDNLNIKHFESIVLSITPDDGPEQTYELPLPPPQTGAEARITPVHDTVPVGNWAGKRIHVRVRTATRNNEKYSAWSNAVVMDVVTPLAQPALTVQPTAAGYELRWSPSLDELTHRVFRMSPGLKQPLELGQATGESFTDKTSQWNTPYEYTVVATQGTAESLPSETVNVNAPDTFPPAAPEGVTALASPQGVDISWRRSPEPDVNGYYVYRSQPGGTAFTRLGTLLTLPVFTDTSTEHGKTYSYEVSAIDTSGNESAPSKAAEVQLP